MWTIPASEELSTLVALSSSSTQSVVSNTPPFIREKLAYLAEVGVTEQILRKFPNY